MEQANDFYLFISRLDLDDYNKEVNEGLHVLNMFGTWMSMFKVLAGWVLRMMSFILTQNFQNNGKYNYLKLTLEELK